jgi:hypothetical protein
MHALEWIGAVGSIATVGLAIIVWVEARRIRHTEWLTRSVGMWQAFNEMLLANGLAETWHTLLDDGPTDPIKGSDKHILYSYVNIIYTEYQMAESNLINRRYAVTSIRENVKQLAPWKSLICPVLEYTGYEPQFVRLIAEYPNMNFPWD